LHKRIPAGIMLWSGGKEYRLQTTEERLLTYLKELKELIEEQSGHKPE